MANMPQSRTAGGPPGTVLTGPLWITSSMDQASTAAGMSAISTIGPYTKPNMPVNASAFMSLADVAGLTGMVVPKTGSIVGISVCRNTANTAGTWSTRLKLNGIIQFTASVAAAGRTLRYFTSNLTSYPVSAGDIITLKMLTASGYTSSTGDFAAHVWIQ